MLKSNKKMNKDINYFADVAKEDNTQPKVNPTNRSTEVADPEEKARKRNKIIR
jgi:predicted RNA-binding protein